MNRPGLVVTGMLTAGALLLAVVGAHAQDANVIVLRNADSLVAAEIGGEQVRQLIGNVHIEQGKVNITCDRAVQFLVSDRILMEGHVIVRDDSVTITAPRGMYYPGPRRAEAYDRVTLDDGKSRLRAEDGEYHVTPGRAFFRSRVVAVDSATTLYADSLVYERPVRRTLAYGRVLIENHEENFSLSGGAFEHIDSTAYSRMTIDPVLLQVDSTDGVLDTLVVKSLVMEAFRDSTRRLVATDSVRIVRSTFSGRAGRAVFFTAGDSITLRASPVLWYERTQITGDSMNIHLIRRQLNTIDVLGSAFAASNGDSLRPARIDQLTGETIRLQFEKRKLSRIDVDVKAISAYYVYEDSAANGLNRTSGDKVIMQFADGKAKSISVIGGVEGTYFPENLVSRKERTFDLPGLVRRADRPSLGPDDRRLFDRITHQREEK